MSKLSSTRRQQLSEPYPSISLNDEFLCCVFVCIIFIYVSLLLHRCKLNLFQYLSACINHFNDHIYSVLYSLVPKGQIHQIEKISKLLCIFKFLEKSLGLTKSKTLNSPSPYTIDKNGFFF